MSLTFSSEYHYRLYRARQERLLSMIAQQWGTSGMVLLFANTDFANEPFVQESSFYYLTGLQESGIVCELSFDGHTQLYYPTYTSKRSQWMLNENSHLDAFVMQSGAKKVSLGSSIPGYQTSVLFEQKQYQALVDRINEVIAQGGYIATLLPASNSCYVQQQLIIQRLSEYVPHLKNQVKDISSFLAMLRRTKDEHEYALMIEAAEITIQAHQAAAQEIQAGITEKIIEMIITSCMYDSQARHAFLPIVASGVNGTVLHYTQNNSVLKDGDLVVIDIGAQYEHYCADVTRTYPVSGAFSKRQKELYEIVLETQRYIETCARPGVWLNNKEKPEESLNHLAQMFFAQKGYAQYFPHGIGHYLGLDTHDVGDYNVPLQVGDVITIEPGIYIAEEKIGIRIEDDYLITKTGVICLTDALPKDPVEIEEMMSVK